VVNQGNKEELGNKYEKDIRTWDEQLITFGESLNY